MNCQMSRHPLPAQETTELHLTEAWRVHQGSVTSSCPVGAEARPLSCVYGRNSCATPAAHGKTPMGLHPQSIHKCQIASLLHTWHQGMRRFGTLFCHQPGWNFQCKHFLQWEQHDFFAAFSRAQLSHLWLFCFIVLCISPQTFFHGTMLSETKMHSLHWHFPRESMS